MTQNQQLNSTISEDLSEESYRQMVDYLENLLRRQVERTRKYDLDSAMEIGEEAGKIAYVLSENQVLGKPEFANEKARIDGLYKELGLIISSERQEVAEKLKQIRMGIKTLSAYGDNG